MQEKERRMRQGGFTMTELLIVMVIIGLLAALVGPKLFQHVGKAKTKSAQAQVSMFGTALDAFYLDTGRYPTTEEGLKALRDKPQSESLKGWDGPYLTKNVPPDPWGNEYRYKCPGEHGSYDLSSFGADNAEGGDKENADVTNWEQGLQACGEGLIIPSMEKSPCGLPRLRNRPFRPI